MRSHRGSAFNQLLYAVLEEEVLKVFVKQQVCEDQLKWDLILTNSGWRHHIIHVQPLNFSLVLMIYSNLQLCFEKFLIVIKNYYYYSFC